VLTDEERVLRVRECERVRVRERVSR